MNSIKSDFSKTLIKWYFGNKRALPWRQTKDPYHIWLSEIILQQTRVEQGTPYYHKFAKAFPTVFKLAQAKEQEVLKLWQGLGYYSRARNLHATAKIVVATYNGIFPKTYKELLALKGVGDYTASAIGSICFNLPTAVVDGNVYRALSRIYGITTPIDSSGGIKEFKTLAQSLLDTSQPGTFNQAIMEFGARQCKPKNPACDICVFKADCQALANNSITKLPVKQGKIKIKKRYLNYLVVQSDLGQTRLQQRTQKGIWHMLYEFPNVETNALANRDQILTSTAFSNLALNNSLVNLSLYNDKPIVHKLSHQHLYASFWIVTLPKIETQAIQWANINEYPVPVLMERFIESFGF